MSRDPRLCRRAFLRGVGVTLGLPFLESLAKAAPQSKPPVRLAFLYTPYGANMHHWTPQGQGAGFELPFSLEPLKNVREDLLVLTGLDHRREDASGNPHPRGISTFLSSAPIGKIDPDGFGTDATVDQIAAKAIGKDTILPSVELGVLDSFAKHGSNLSWRAPGSPMSQETNPRLAFMRLFGDPRGDVCRTSVLDYVQENARQLKTSLGRRDQDKVEEYFESVRAIERRIQAIEKRRETRAVPKVDFPDANPADAFERLRLMQDVIVLAFQTDTTRVATLVYSPPNGAQTHSYRHIGVSIGHHAHPSPGKEWIEQIETQMPKIDRYHVEQLAGMLEKMKAVKEGSGTLLDNCAVVYGSGIRWGPHHDWDSVPILVAGKAGGRLKTGRHLIYGQGRDVSSTGILQPVAAAGAPLSNLWLSLLDCVGVRLDRIADSTGPLKGLS